MTLSDLYTLAWIFFAGGAAVCCIWANYIDTTETEENSDHE